MVLDVTEVEDLPNTFFAKTEGHTACKVIVNWLGVKASMETAIDRLAKYNTTKLTDEVLSAVKDYRSKEAVMYCAGIPSRGNRRSDNEFMR